MKISEIISSWYKKSKRNLPWRDTRDAYSIWLSEIILQQTRVEQGLPYYNKFTDRFPDLHSLASAGEEEVIKLWQGLGYYSRARNLLFAAKQVEELYGGIFPTNYDSLIKLKGVGPYTAAAIASFSSDEAVAVVDGNVARVISRLFAVSEPVNSVKGLKVISGLAGKLLDKKNPGTHNQAIMEFGALQCTPGKPDCGSCPLQDKCEAFRLDRVAEFPIKLKKAKVRERFFTYLIIDHEGFTYINRRRENDIWKHMYEFPLIEKNSKISPEELGQHISEYTGLGSGEFTIKAISKQVKHQLSHRLIITQFVHMKILKFSFNGLPNWEKIKPEAIADRPLPRLIDRYLEEQTFSAS